MPEAFIAREFLKQQGIFATIKDEHHIQANFYYSFVLGLVKLQVAEEEVEEATRLLNEVEYNYCKRDENQCSNCGSHRTVRVFRYTIGQISILIWSLYAIFLIILIPKKFSHLKCMKCREKIFPKYELEDNNFDPSLVE